MKTKLKAPMPWFGGKSTVSDDVWRRFGSVTNYSEPFFGSGAVLLGRPKPFAGSESVNDINGWLCNFWRALQADHESVARYANWPVSELDLHARGDWLFYRAGVKDWLEQIRSDPEFFDAKSAGWWVWGHCCWIGTGWGPRQRPHLGTAGRGVNRQLPHLGDAGQAIWDYFATLSTRLRRVRVACGNWERVLGGSVTWRHGVTGIVLDPPYEEGKMAYAEHSGVSREVRDWCAENGDNRMLRIALCGLDGEHDLPGWDCVPWKAAGGYGSQRADGTNNNRKRERIWFSPGCLSSDDLFLK